VTPSPKLRFEQWAALLLLASFALSSSFVLQSPYEGATLDAGYSDSMRMVYSTHLFLRYGTDVFRVPLGELSDRDPSPRGHVVWPQQPFIYPPGALLVFLPWAYAEYDREWPEGAVHRATILWLVAIGHVCLFVFIRELRRQGGELNLLVGVLSFMTVLQFSANGFYDPIYMALAALGVSASKDDRHSRSLLWLGAAAFFHYRAFFFFPLALKELTSLLRARNRSRGAVLDVGGGLALAALGGLTFLQSASSLDDTAAINPVLDESFGTGGVVVVVAATVAAGLYFLRVGERTTAVLLAWIVAVDSFLPFARPWHTLGLYPLFLLPREGGRKREVLLVWMLVVAAVAFRYFPNLRWLARGFGSLVG
jgi:hypothetical protein